MDYALPEILVYKIQEIGKKYKVERILLFGSRARGDHKATSDIDLAVYTAAGFMSKGHFSSEIDDLETLLKIDVVFIDAHTDSRFIENINKEGVVIYERL
jgi:predicted nucleotidyltransferase